MSRERSSYTRGHCRFASSRLVLNVIFLIYLCIIHFCYETLNYFNDFSGLLDPHPWPQDLISGYVFLNWCLAFYFRSISHLRFHWSPSPHVRTRLDMISICISLIAGGLFILPLSHAPVCFSFRRCARSAGATIVDKFHITLGELILGAFSAPAECARHAFYYWNAVSVAMQFWVASGLRWA